MSEENDGRLSFDEAVHFVQQQPGKAAFAAMPVFGERNDDAEQRAEGARVFIIDGDGAGSYQVRHLSGPFFTNVFGANEILAPADVPERVRSMRFMPTRLEESWLDGQIQVLIQKLMVASGQETPHMPDYEHAPAVGNQEAVFPVSFIGRDPKREH